MTATKTVTTTYNITLSDEELGTLLRACRILEVTKLEEERNTDDEDYRKFYKAEAEDASILRQALNAIRFQ